MCPLSLHVVIIWKKVPLDRGLRSASGVDLVYSLEKNGDRFGRFIFRSLCQIWQWFFSEVPKLDGIHPPGDADIDIIC
jgi:hypothetical protein